MADLLQIREAGLYCEAGDFYIDPWRTVSRAVVTHAHGDHARAGMGKYFCARPGVGVLQTRVGKDAAIHPLNYGETQFINGVRVSLHPAGHLLGSAQVRVEHRGEVWVAAGDYKLAADPTCAPFEPVRCHTFITESTFGLPIYRWADSATIFAEINRWWSDNQAAGRTSVIFAYALGKAQRILAGIDPTLGPLLVHNAVDTLVKRYVEAGVSLPAVERADEDRAARYRGRALVIIPPAADQEKHLRKFGDVSLAVASGWMQVRGARRRQTLDRGFVLSDHADWPGLLTAIEATGAERILVTHGFTQALTRYLNENGKRAEVLATRYQGETDIEAAAE